MKTNTDAEKVLNARKSAKGRDSLYVVYFDGGLIVSKNGKYVWTSEILAFKAITNILGSEQYVPNNEGSHFIRAFRNEVDANDFVQNLISSGRLEIREIKL